MLRKFVTIIEPLVLAVMLLAFWYASPTRDGWLWLLALIPVIWVLRWVVYKHWWTRTPLDGFLVAFVGLSILNVFVAPYRRSADIPYSFFVLMGRPLLGIALYSYFVERARLRGRMNSLVIATLILGAIVAILALGASQWNDKSYVLQFITDALPRIGESLTPFDARGGFNANESGGALAWVCPLIAGLIAYRWGRFDRVLHAVTAGLFGLLFLALFLGQSRFALVGTLMALSVLIWLLVPQKRIRWLAWGILVAVAVLEILIIRDVFVTPEESILTQRDEASMVGRVDIWNSALGIMGDYPLTGVGLNMFRDGRVRERYPAPGFLMPVLPHAHQEWLQAGADMGIPGFLVFIGLELAAAFMLYRAYRLGDSSARAVIAGVGAGLFAHGFFGLGDAITLWDRFAFLFWWLLGLGGAQAYLVRDKSQL
jgi:O-antigen ligase